MTNGVIKFYRGSESTYTTSPDEYTDGIYFATDTQKIIMNNKEYGGDSNKKVRDVELNAQENGIRITYTDSTATTLLFGKASATIDGLMSKEDKNKLDTLPYTSKIEDKTIKTVTAIGGIPANTTVASLEGKSYDEIFDTLIFPTIQPTKTDPSVSVARKTGIPDIREVGSTAWTSDDFTVTAKQGEIRINNVKKQDYAGAANNIVVNNVPVDMSTYGKKSITGSATFDAGPQPLDSKGGNATSVTKYPGGKITSDPPIYVYVVYPFYANNTNITTFSKLPLVKSDVSTFVVNYVSEVGSNKHTIKVPALRDITKIEMLNTLSNNYEEITKSNFIKTAEDIGGVTYNVYTRNQGVNSDATFKFTYKNN